MKDVNLIRELLDKYYEGNTSETEEQLLLDYLLSDTLPEEFEPDREVVCSLLIMSREHKPSKGFEERIIASLGTGNDVKKLPSGRELYWKVSGIAASLIIALSIWFLIGEKRYQADTFSSPELAYAETVRVLQLISSEMNRGRAVLTDMEPVKRVEDGITAVETTGMLIRKGFGFAEDIVERIGKDNDNDNEE